MPISPTDFDYIRKLVFERSAIVLETGKEYLVESRMVSLLHREKIDSVETLVQNLQKNRFNGLADRVVDALTTNETSFFRDIKPFEILKKEILPKVIEANRAKQELNIWCAASSSGQEPFSIAMVIRENFPKLDTWRINFIASDISPSMLDRCRSGVYSQLEVNRGLPALLLVKYFERNGAEWKVKEDLRKMIDFRQINLAEPLPRLPRMDIVFCRNVLIYFDLETKKKVMQQIRRVMRPGGFLFLGAAETTLNIDRAFQRISATQSGCYELKG